MKVKLSDVFTLFRRTRNYEEGVPYEELCLRWVCRYHLFVKKGDYSVIDKFKKPKSRWVFINMCSTLIREMDAVEDWGFMDSREIYDNIRIMLHRLRAYAKHYPLIWWLVFRLHL